MIWSLMHPASIRNLPWINFHAVCLTSASNKSKMGNQSARHRWSSTPPHYWTAWCILRRRRFLPISSLYPQESPHGTYHIRLVVDVYVMRSMFEDNRRDRITPRELAHRRLVPVNICRILFLVQRLISRAEIRK